MEPEESIDQMAVPAVKELTEGSVINNPEVWMNPDMTAAELEKMMAISHADLLDIIKGLGCTGYSDMINRKRVEYICNCLDKGNDKNIIQLMFEAGFRSRSTASSEFKRIVGCTPSEYQKNSHHNCTVE